MKLPNDITSVCVIISNCCRTIIVRSRAMLPRYCCWQAADLLRGTRTEPESSYQSGRLKTPPAYATILRMTRAGKLWEYALAGVCADQQLSGTWRAQLTHVQRVANAEKWVYHPRSTRGGDREPVGKLSRARATAQVQPEAALTRGSRRYPTHDNVMRPACCV